MSESTWSDLLAAHEQARRPRRGGTPAHEPKAVVLTCVDARVDPSHIFGVEPGALFTLRTPGHVLSPVVLTGIDLAVAELGVDLVVVLGHTDCAAMTAATFEGAEDTYLAPVVTEIRPVVTAHPDDDIDTLAGHNAVRVAEEIAAHEGPAGHAIRDRAVELRAAVHNLETAHLTELPLPTPHQTT